jgi:hypothetical protein
MHPGRFRTRGRGGVQPIKHQHRARLIHPMKLSERLEQERRRAGVTFREVAHAYLEWLEHVKAPNPRCFVSIAANWRSPACPTDAGAGETAGRVMKAIGDRPAASVTTEEIDALLHSVADSGASPRTVNRVRDVVRTVFNFGMRSRVYKLMANPARATDRRRT